MPFRTRMTYRKLSLRSVSKKPHTKRRYWIAFMLITLTINIGIVLCFQSLWLWQMNADDPRGETRQKYPDKSIRQTANIHQQDQQQTVSRTTERKVEKDPHRSQILGNRKEAEDSNAKQSYLLHVEEKSVAVGEDVNTVTKRVKNVRAKTHRQSVVRKEMILLPNPPKPARNHGLTVNKLAIPVIPLADGKPQQNLSYKEVKPPSNMDKHGERKTSKPSLGIEMHEIKPPADKPAKPSRAKTAAQQQPSIKETALNQLQIANIPVIKGETVWDKAVGRNRARPASALKESEKEPVSDTKHTAVNNTDGGVNLSSWSIQSTNLTRLKNVLKSLESLPPDDYLSEDVQYFEPRQTLINNHILKPLINSTVCSKVSPYLLVIIPSVDSHFRQRSTIRKTWASPAYHGGWPRDARNYTNIVKLIFFLGVRDKRTHRALRDESRRYGDLVQVDLVENYRNLSLKIAAAFEWTASNCAGASHVMKVDEDTFVNLSLTLDLLSEVARRVALFVLGFGHHQRKPVVVRKGKWFVPQELYPFPYFPRYLLGHSYIVSGDSVRQLARVWRYMPLVPNEDVYMTGILAKVVGVSRIHCPWFANERSRLGKCELVHGMSVTQTKFKPYQQLDTLWYALQSGHCV